MIDNPNVPFMFIVDTNKYSGNFERQMTAYVTGRIGECMVGEPEARIFYQEMGLKDGKDKKFSDYEQGDWRGISLECSYEDFDNPFQFVINLGDEHGCHRPTTLYPTPGWFSIGGDCFRDGEEEKALEARNKKNAEAKDSPLRKYGANNSVAIFMDREPTTEEITILKERAYKFAEFCKTHPNEFEQREISIEGFRIVKKETTETELPV